MSSEKTSAEKLEEFIKKCEVDNKCSFCCKRVYKKKIVDNYQESDDTIKFKKWIHEHMLKKKSQ